MKKLYRKAVVVHPTPPIISDHLIYLLPATLLTLTAALSPQERELLAYLISSYSSSNNHRKTNTKTVDHTPCFDCYCFNCYTTYWVKWDSSPNRELIHRIIDDFENGLSNQNTTAKDKGGKKKKAHNKGNKERKKKSVVVTSVELKDEVTECSEAMKEEEEEDTSVVFVTRDEDLEANNYSNNNVEEMEMEMEKGGSIRRFVSFVGEKIWGVWG